jgi:hypothetical protein
LRGGGVLSQFWILAGEKSFPPPNQADFSPSPHVGIAIANHQSRFTKQKRNREQKQ